MFYLFIFGHAGSLLLCKLSSSCGEWGLLASCGARASIAVASLAAHGLRGTQTWVVAARGLSSCGVQTQLLRGMRGLPGSGIKPVSPALAGGFLINEPSGKAFPGFLALLWGQ